MKMTSRHLDVRGLAIQPVLERRQISEPDQLMTSIPSDHLMEEARFIERHQALQPLAVLARSPHFKGARQLDLPDLDAAPLKALEPIQSVFMFDRMMTGVEAHAHVAPELALPIGPADEIP